jgi:hypothetical protein
MTPVTEGLSAVVVGVDMSVDLEEVEDEVRVVKVLVLELDFEVVKVPVLVPELDAVAGPMGKGVCTELEGEAVDTRRDMVAEGAIDRGKTQCDAQDRAPWAVESLL